MKIYSAPQTRSWDVFTIEKEPVSSFELMNRAVRVLTEWFIKTYPLRTRPIWILCGTGNNGGDGLALARHLSREDYDAKVLVCDFSGKHSEDFDRQMAVLPALGRIPVITWQAPGSLELIPPDALVVDALFGSGLNRCLEGAWAQMVAQINRLPNEIVSIDLPSGLLADEHTPGEAVVCASKTFSFERPKLAFFMPENAERVGQWYFGSIGLLPEFETTTAASYSLITPDLVQKWIKPRSKFAHKGSFGHALIIAGSYGKMGAAVLASRACLRTGAGLLTVYSPASGYMVLQTSVPEAMFKADQRAKFWSAVPDLANYSAIGVGPGIDRRPETAIAMKGLLQAVQSALVLDADALNLLAENPGWWAYVPENTILTPHPKEFERLFGKAVDDFERLVLLQQQAADHKVIIVLKGAHTAIALPSGECWFNNTGNPGMATGGSGDVLTGVITGLLAQGYTAKQAAMLGVYLHGLAGDLAAEQLGEQAIIAGDLAAFLPAAWSYLSKPG
ncbi:MAG TPA: NAD(P)H-hydrate dehydratase [Saprospiraceae bacterium]|nr:NAD(P)H-hydrate dehydratase [Saprospiraceae bacterium]